MFGQSTLTEEEFNHTIQTVLIVYHQLREIL